MDNKIEKYCTGCGLCISMAKAKVVENERGFYKPISGDEKWLKKICPSCTRSKEYIDEKKIWGRSNNVYLGWSNNNAIRKKASSGGVISEIAAFLLSSKMVDVIIHTGISDVEQTKTKIVLSQSQSDVERWAGSRYSISHPLNEISKLDFKKKYAFIGKPCDIVALKNLFKVEPKYEKSIICTISFFCMGTPSVIAQEKLLRELGCNSNDECASLVYRGNGWPGYTTLTKEDGTTSRLDYNSSWGHILGRDLMPACHFCVDGIGEQADISCGDAWYLTKDNKPDFSEHEGRNLIFARSDLGRQIIKQAKDAGKILIEEYSSFEKELSLIQKSQYERRLYLGARIKAMKLMRRAVPQIDKKILKAYSRAANKKVYIKTYLGTCKRIIKGRL